MDELGFLDQFFAETILKKGGLCCEKIALSLARLMRGSRVGNLCMTKKQLGEAIESLPSSVLQPGHGARPETWNCERTKIARIQDSDIFFPKTPIVVSGDRYYLQRNWVYETQILRHVLRLRQNTPPSYFDQSRFEENLTRISDQLTPIQTDAIRESFKRSLSVICGGPGTGKTYTAVHLVNLLFSSLNREKKRELHVCIAAPTGKAASHLHVALGSCGHFDPALHIEASTLHKLLKLKPGGNRLFVGERIDADLIIVDEASMIDVPLLSCLLEAIGDDSFLVLIGDPNQLPPVDAGSLFAEMGELFGVCLDQCMRTKELFLRQIALAINQGDAEEFFRIVSLSRESFSLETLYASIDPILSSVQPDPKTCLEKYSRFRVLNPIRQGPIGTNALNEQIMQRLQRKGAWWAAPILAIANDSFSGIYNGMNGILIGEGIRVDAAYFPDPFSGEMRRFPFPPPYEVAFCLSVHKAQGCEFEEVFAFFPPGSEPFGKEALYTAVTRAKKRIEIRGDRDTLQKMIASSSRTTSGLCARARSMLPIF